MAEIIIRITGGGCLVTQKPKGVALTIHDLRMGDFADSIIHYTEDHSIEIVATFTNPTVVIEEE